MGVCTLQDGPCHNFTMLAEKHIVTSLEVSCDIQGFSESLQHYTKMLKANCVDHSIYGAQAGLYNCT